MTTLNCSEFNRNARLPTWPLCIAVSLHQRLVQLKTHRLEVRASNWVEVALLAGAIMKGGKSKRSLAMLGGEVIASGQGLGQVNSERGIHCSGAVWGWEGMCKQRCMCVTLS
jgi:hypothetical protein